MNPTIVILCGTIILLLGTLLIYRLQIRVVCQQLAFLEAHESNLRITSATDFGGLGTLTRLLNALLERQRNERITYQQKELVIAETYTSLSHDIRTPLTSLDGYFQLLADSDAKDEQNRYLSIIRERIDSLKEMLEELFLFTKLKNASYPLELSPCDLNRIVKNTILSYYGEWKQKDIEPEISLPEAPCMILGNQQALRRTLQNIIKNGLVHGEASIQIQLTVCPPEVTLSIRNTLTHPEQVDTSRVFERFYMADTRQGSSSTGLGLPIAREFVLRMNGTIEAAVEENEFMIRLRFPVAQSPSEHI